MVDPILDDELKRSRRMKQYQQYQDQLDQIDEADKKSTSEPSGEMQGKKVKKIATEGSVTENLFNRSIKKTS